MSRIAEQLGGQGYGYPRTPGWKEPTTSHDAAIAIGRRVENLRGLVLAAIAGAGPHGMTADEVADKLGGMDKCNIRPRVTELGPLHMNKIEKTGDVRINKSGAGAAVWRIKA